MTNTTFEQLAPDTFLRSDLPPDQLAARYPHVWKGLTGTPWAITEEMRDVIVTIAARRLSGEKIDAAELPAVTDGRDAHREPYRISYSSRSSARAGRRGGGQGSSGQIAVLPLYGVMAARLGLIGQMSGGQSVQSFMADFKDAMADDTVSSILIDIDSPGGSTDLVAELGQLIYDARGDKPIAAIANTDACSAAYWVLAQADESACTPSGKVGSVGVYGIHQDLSAALAKAGVKPTVIQADGSPHKTELHPFGPLSPEALDYHQGVVNAHFDMFVDAVARGTGVAASRVKADFGGGRVLMAKPALKVGMIDRVATFDQMLQRLAQGLVPAGKRSGAVAVTRHLEIDADAPIDEPPAEPDCANCEHAAHEGPCDVEGCDCETYEAAESDEPEPAAVAAIADSAGPGDASPAAAGAARPMFNLEAIPEGDLMLAVDREMTQAEVAELRDAIAAALPGRPVLITSAGITLSTAEPVDPDLAAPAVETPQAGHPDSLLHRRAVRAALRPPAATAATEREDR